MSFCALAGAVAAASIAGNEIVGRWEGLNFFWGLNSKARPVFSGLPGRRAKIPLDAGVKMLAEQFVNWPDDPTSILAFVRKFGAFSNPEKGAEFRQSLEEWRGYQRWLRKMWWHWSSSDTIPSHPFSEPEAGEQFRQTIEDWQREPVFRGKIRRLPGPGSFTALVREGEWITSIEGHLLYVIQDLFRFLYLEMASYPSDCLRICDRPGCGNPYFTTQYLRQRFCSDLCAQWGQRQWKRQWWKENGESWRKQRRLKESKGEKNVTRKTR
jgi:hypothetical protein